MAIRSKLTVRDPSEGAGSNASQSTTKREPTEEERAVRKERVAAAKDALKRSVGMRGEHVAPARSAIKTYLQKLNDPRQPDDAQFKALIEAPFHAPPKKREQRR
jgi:hypothetical protein